VAKSKPPTAREVARAKATETVSDLDQLVRQFRDGLRSMKSLEKQQATTYRMIVRKLSELRDQLVKAQPAELGIVDVADEEAA